MRSHSALNAPQYVDFFEPKNAAKSRPPRGMAHEGSEDAHAFGAHLTMHSCSMGVCKILLGFIIALSGFSFFTLFPLLLPLAAPYVHASYLRASSPSLDERINATLCPSVSSAQRGSTTDLCAFTFIPPNIPRLRYVRRDDINSAVIRTVSGDNFAVIEGPNRVGKSVAVRIAVSALSRSRLVRTVECLTSHGVVEVLAALLLADLRNLDWNANLRTTLRPVVAMPTFEDFHVAMLHRPRQNPEPLFVVESAEHLSVPVLLTLLSFGEAFYSTVPVVVNTNFVASKTMLPFLFVFSFQQPKSLLTLVVVASFLFFRRLLSSMRSLFRLTLRVLRSSQSAIFPSHNRLIS